MNQLVILRGPDDGRKIDLIEILRLKENLLTEIHLHMYEPGIILIQSRNVTGSGGTSRPQFQ
jgi:hypothetical protein